MEKINLDTLRALMAEDGRYTAMGVEILSRGKVYRIDKTYDMSLELNDGVPSFKTGKLTYTLIDGEESKLVFHSLDEMAGYVKNHFADKGVVTLSKIDDCGTMEEFMASADFRHADMAELLEKYSDCDMFSLTCGYNDGYDENHTHGIYNLDRDIGENAYKLIEFEQRDLCHMLYAYTPESEKKKLPPFSKLYAQIKAEVAGLFATDSARPIFVESLYSEGKMNYKGKSPILQQIYSTAGFLQNCREDIDAQYQNTQTRPIDGEFDSGVLKELKPYVKRVLVTYCWHCTVSGTLAKVFFIELNDATKKWLLNFKDDFAIDGCGLADLAFYKNGDCRFSSCTHEGHHTDIPQE